ncbi:MAG TPA: immune inhibitor A [Anaerolineae bacterium]|nr:immune inhibitor A [Anaerolineae bacterium]
MGNRRTLKLLLAVSLIVSMLAAPLAVSASSPTKRGPDNPTGRELLDSLRGRQFPVETAPRDEQVIAEAAGVPLGATAAEAEAITDAWLKQFTARNEKGGPNPIAAKQRLEDIAAAEAQGKSPMAVGLGEIGEAKMLMIPFEFNGSNTLDRCDGDGNFIDQVTVEGPLHGTIPNPANFGDNNTIWTDDFSIEWYENLMFGDGPGVVRPDLNGGAGVDMTGVSARRWYEEQSENLYTIDGDIYPAWIQLPNSVAYYGWDGDELSPDGIGYPCNGTPSGFGFEFARDTVWGVNAVDPDFDWAQYDTDGDQIVDHLMLIHAGVDNSAGGGEFGNFQLWAHSWDMYCDNDGDGELEYGCIVQGQDTPDDPDDDIYAANYTHIPEDADIGVVVHEYGHDIGLPDYYDTSGATNNSSSHWDVMNSGSWNGPLGGSHPVAFSPWARWFFGWSDPLHVDYDATAQEVMIGQSDPTPSGTEDTVWVHLPDQMEEVPNLAGDGGGMHAVLGNYLFSTFQKEFDLTGASAPVFSFDTYFDLEEDWDYTYVRASTDGGATWTILLNNEGVYATANPNGSTAWLGVGGLTGMHDGRLTFDLTPYAGGSVWLQFAYVTDAATQNPGFWLDNVALDDGAANLYSNDMDDVSDWTNNGGWEQVPFNLSTPHYYMLEWRNSQGSIASEGHNWNYQSVAHSQSGWLVDRVPNNTPGLLVWYRNNFYNNNNVVAGGREFHAPAAGAKGSTLLIDAHYDGIQYSGGIWDPSNNEAAPKVSNRRASSDGAFTLETTPAWMLHDYGRIVNPVLDFGSRPPVPAFHDSMRSVPGWFLTPAGSVGRVLRDSSVVVPARGIYSTRIRGLEADNAHLAVDGDLTAYWGYTVGGLPLGSGNPGDDHVQYGVHFQVLNRAADGSYGVVKIWNSMFEFDGSVQQAGRTNPVVEGTYIDVDVMATNIGGAVADGLFLAPIDPDAMYVDGSAEGGAYPLNAAAAAQLAAARGLTDLAARAEGAAPDEVVAVAWSGPVPTGGEVAFGFTVKAMVASGEVQHDVAAFDGATFINAIAGSPLTIVDNSAYPVSRSRRFNVDRDTFINGAQPGAHYGDAQVMWAGFFNQMRPLVHTPINGIPGDAYVDAAYLYLYVVEGRGFTNWSQSVINVEARAVTTPWMPLAANWTMPWTMPGGDYGPVVGTNHIGSGKLNTWMRLDVTEAVTDMLRGSTDQGFILTNDDSTGVRYALAAKEFWDASKAGYLRIYFRTAN